MKKYILYVIVLWVLAFVWQSIAHADELPKKFLGQWCESQAREQTYVLSDDCNDQKKLRITSKYIEGLEYSCDFIKIKTKKDTALINGRCHSGGEDYNAAIRISLWRQSFLDLIIK